MADISSYIRSQSSFEKQLDRMLRPIMRVISGACTEEPQGTHSWNYVKIPFAVYASLRIEKQIQSQGIRGELPAHILGIPFCHLPTLGGWKNYSVLAPTTQGLTWYVGWFENGKAYVSLIPIKGAVRMLIGPNVAYFFAIDATEYRQLTLQELGKGKIGSSGMFSRIPLR